MPCILIPCPVANFCRWHAAVSRLAESCFSTVHVHPDPLRSP